MVSDFQSKILLGVLHCRRLGSPEPWELEQFAHSQNPKSKIQNQINRFDVMLTFHSALVSDIGITRDYRRH